MLSDGVVAKNAWIRDAQIDTSWYYVDTNGEMQSSRYTPDNYWLRENGEYDSTLGQKADAILARVGMTREDYLNMTEEAQIDFILTLNHEEAMIIMEFEM